MKVLKKEDMEKIQKLISEERLRGYRGKDNNPKSCLKRYQYDIEISKEFYPLLHVLEIGFRNSLYIAWAENLGDDWLLNKKTILRPSEIDKISKARENLQKKSKIPETGQIIAELNFGFWVSLLNDHYGEYNRKLVKRIFPFIQKKSDQDLVKIKKDFNSFRNFRNRIFHYEPIWHWGNLKDYLNKIRKYILLINPSLMFDLQKESIRNLEKLIEKRYVYKNM